MKLATTCNWRKASAALLCAFATLLFGQTLMAQGSFCWAIVAKQNLTLNGGALVDSFDSQDPNQSTGGQYDAAKRQDGGDIASLSASVGAVTDSGNTTVYGRAATTPGGSITLNGKSSIGSLAWVNGGNSGVQPGWYLNNQPAISIPDATLTNTTFSSLQNTGGKINGTNYTYVITNGFYQGSAGFSLSGSQTVCIVGQVVLYFPSGFQMSGQSYIYIPPGSKLTIYLGGQTALSGGGIINAAGYASNCSLIGLPSCSSIQYSGNSGFTGTVYAPEAAFQMSGGGSTTINFAGALVANSVVISGGYQFHYDESLCAATAPACPTCTVSYPYASANPLTSIAFNESEVLRASTMTVTGITDTIKLWYNDEHAMALGIRRVIVKTKVGGATVSTTNDYPITALTSNPGSSTNVAAGTTLLTGDQSAVDMTNRPIFPALFLTDTTQDSTSRAGDWQFGGTPILPSAIFGTWKSGVKTVDKTKATPTVTVDLDADPAKNDWNLGNGDPAPAGLMDEGYGCEVRWNVSDLKLLPGHSYRLYFMVHDGDQNHIGGDAGQGCVNICVPCTPLTATPLTNVSVCAGGTAAFSTTVVGGTGPYAYPFTFQWYLGASALNGQTNSTLVLNNVNSSDAGAYSVVVTGSCGNPVTNSATLTVNQSVTITMPPADTAACLNGTAFFSVAASGTALDYQWYHGATLLSGQTNSSLTVANVGPNDTGTYSVVVSDTCGDVVTNSAMLALNANVLIANPPSNATNCPGTTAHFSVNASGTGLGYQWYKGANLLPGQTSSTLTLGSVSAVDAGIYSVVVTGVCGLPITNSATLFVNANTVISTPPTDTTVCPGTPANFSVNAIGSGLSYQWYKGVSLLNGQTASILTLPSVTATDAGTYSVVVSGACGLPVTNSATLAVNSNVVIVGPPANSTNCPGTAAFFFVNATGTGLTYQWYHGGSGTDLGTKLDGQIGSTLTFSNVTAQLSGVYSVVVSGACGNAVTNSATLFVNANVVIPTPPTNTTVCPGMTANFSVNASGTGLTYQWYNATGPLNGKTNGTLSLPGVSAADAGVYRVVISGACGVPVTNSATLFVNANTVITAPPADVTSCPGTTANFSISATGTGLSYQWYKSTGPISGQTNSTLSLANVSAADAGAYKVAVSGTCGVPLTKSATLFVNANTIVTMPPTNTIVCPGTTANFAVNATGSGLTYQWYNAAGPIGGQTGSTLSLSNVGAADVGQYTVVVGGACGLPVTNSAYLLLNFPTVITNSLQNATSCPGSSVFLVVGATASSFQWYKDGSPLNNQTMPFLQLDNVTAADAGIYSVVVGGECGSPLTNSATVVINTNALITTPLANSTNCPGTTANFSVNAVGTGLTYQWYKGTTLLTGHTTSVLTLNGVTGASAGTYSVVVSGVCGVPLTNGATLFVNANTVITTPPTNTTVCPGMTANFAVTATGTGLTYQWYNAAGPLSGQTNGTLSLPNVSAANAGPYSVVVSGACGVPVTNSATLFVNANTIVTMPPTNATNCPGTTANFSVNATGTGLTYQWYNLAGPLNGQTNSTLTLPNVQVPDVGSYTVVVSGLCGTPVTKSAGLFVNSNTVVLLPPKDATVCPGMTANFNVEVTGTDFKFQWYNSAGPLSGQTNNTLSLPGVSAADAGIYSVVVSGVCGLPTTNSAALFVNTNTLVTMPPANATNCLGTDAHFSVNAIGTGLTYQWYKGTTLLNGETANFLTLPGVRSANAGTYSVVVSGACGVPVTNSATLFLSANTIVTMPPTNTTVCPGMTASFSVNASGSELTYQWYNIAGPLAGQTNNTLSLPNVSAADAGTYSVVVSGACGSPVTNSATLFVNGNTIISMAPTNTTVCPGMTANFSVNASGTGLSYQWYNIAGPLAGQTNSILSLPNVKPANEGTYNVVVKGACGVPVTNSAFLSVGQVNVVTNGPSNTTNCPGSTAIFTVGATATTYQWYKDGSPLGNQSPVLILDNVSATDAGVYSVVVGGLCGSPLTNSAVLVVNTNALITSPLVNATNCPGTDAHFSVNAIGTGLTYQWYKGTTLLNGETANFLTLPGVRSANAGTYSVVVSGVCGMPVTNSATLFVNANTIISTAPTNTTVCPGMTANFSVNATGTALTYQWYKSTGPLSGQTSSTLSVPTVSAADAGTYSVVVSGVCGMPVTNSATLFVNANTIISTAPTNTTVCPGMTANFSVNASGTGLTYQWYKSTGPLSGQTSSTLSVPTVSAADAGTYTVVVSGVCGSPVTNGAVLSVNQNVSVAAMANVTNNIGTSVTFTALASGTGPFSYQWFRGPTALTGKTNSTLTLGNLQPGDGGTYSVSVSGQCGQAASSAAVLTINQPPTVAITYPTNGSVFVEPATFTVLASAGDPDGVVTNVEIFSSTNGTDFVLISETNNAPYQTVQSNLPAGHYTYMARATDNWGATGVSAPVSVTVVPVNPPDIFTIGGITLNTQDGYQWLTNVACNPINSHANALRIDIHNITNSTIRVVNANGTNNGVPFVISPGAINPGTCWTNVIKFYDPMRVPFFPILTVQLADPIAVGEPDGSPQAIFSGKFLRDGTFLVEFASVPGATYYIQYSSDMIHWKTVFPPFAGTGQHLQWIDSGPPETESLPTTNPTRFYRVLLAN